MSVKGRAQLPVAAQQFAQGLFGPAGHGSIGAVLTMHFRGSVRVRLLWVCFGLFLGCNLKPPIDLPMGGGSGGSGGAGGGAQSTQPPSIETRFFAAVGVSATKLLAEVGNARLELDPTLKDPLTALGECADLLSYCYAPGTATVGDCFARSRQCTSAQPWNEQPCCPTACKTAYEAELARGLGPVDALEKVLFREPDCFPGVRAALEAP